MKLVRTKKGKNDFALFELTVGKLLAFQHCMELADRLTNGGIGPVAQEALQELQYMNLDGVDCWGDSHTAVKIKNLKNIS